VTGLKRGAEGDTLLIAPGSAAAVRWWMIQLRTAGVWETHVIDGVARAFGIPASRGTSSRPDLVTVTAVDRTGKASGASALRLP
jgi:hypothetical protein